MSIIDKVLEQFGRSRDPDYTVGLVPDEVNDPGSAPDGDDSVHEQTEGETGEGVLTEVEDES